MHDFKGRLIATICGLAAILTLTLVIPHRSEAQFASPVRVANTTPQSVPVVTGPGGSPFSTFDHFIIALGSRTGSGNAFTPSATRGLVIDQISWLGDVSTGQSLYAGLSCTTGGNSVVYRFQVPSFAPDPNTAGQDQIIGTILLRIYCDANNTVQVSATRSASTDAGGFNYGNNYTLSGYLLP
jgi:hypothetical protein